MLPKIFVNYVICRVILWKYVFIELAGYFENIGKSKQNSFFKD